MKNEDRFKKILDGCADNVRLIFADCRPRFTDPVESYLKLSTVTVVMTFSEKGFGFGEIALKQTKEGVFLDTECMGLERVKRYFNMLLDSAILDTDNDPEKHRLYNQVMGRSCADTCPVCKEFSENDGERGR